MEKLTPFFIMCFFFSLSYSREEVNDVRDYFTTLNGMNIVEMPSDAHLDGGDVLFTGDEIFVGFSMVIAIFAIL